MQRKWWIMAAGSLAFFFVTATTFTSLAVVLWPMMPVIGLSNADAGLAFALVGLSCGLANLITAGIISRIGSRWTMVLGALVMVAGFGLASIVESRLPFFLATLLMGAGFTLLAPVPVIPLIAYWFREKSSRMLGIYFMVGASGGIVGPWMVNKIVYLSGSWRIHWAAMAASAFVLAIICLFTIEDLPAEASGATAPQPSVPALNGVPYTVGEAVRTWPFFWIAISMLVIQVSITTTHSVLVPHIISGGGTPDAAAFAMTLVGLFGTIAKGISGRLSERISPQLMLVLGVALQAIGFGVLLNWHSPDAADVFALILGAGWGLSWLAAHVLLLRWFGSSASAGVSAIANLVTTFAVLGPWAAGRAKDSTGSFEPVFIVFGVLLAGATLCTALMRGPGKPAARERGDDLPAATPSVADA